MKKIRLKDDLAFLLDYLWHDEEKDYGCNRAKNHVFVIMKRVAKKIGYRKMCVGWQPGEKSLKCISFRATKSVR